MSIECFFLRRSGALLLAASALAITAFAQTVSTPAESARKATPVEAPDPREIPLPTIKTSGGSFPTVDQLPVRAEMPDPLTFTDGTRVTSAEQWPRRREEMKRLLAHYAVGQMPPAPGNVKAREVKS